MKTLIPEFASGFHMFNGSVRNRRAGNDTSNSIVYGLLMAGYSVRFEPKHGTYVNWPTPI